MMDCPQTAAHFLSLLFMYYFITVFVFVVVVVVAVLNVFNWYYEKNTNKSCSLKRKGEE